MRGALFDGANVGADSFYRNAIDLGGGGSGEMARLDGVNSRLNAYSSWKVIETKWSDSDVAKGSTFAHIDAQKSRFGLASEQQSQSSEPTLWTMLI